MNPLPADVRIVLNSINEDFLKRENVLVCMTKKLWRLYVKDTNKKTSFDSVYVLDQREIHKGGNEDEQIKSFFIGDEKKPNCRLLCSMIIAPVPQEDQDPPDGPDRPDDLDPPGPKPKESKNHFPEDTQLTDEYTRKLFGEIKHYKHATNN